MNYKLNPDKSISIVKDILEWSKWFHDACFDGERVIKQEQMGPYFVSTVFLGIDHNFLEKGEPILFETMIFNRTENESIGYQDRCCTYDEALKMHEKAVEYFKRINIIT